MADSYLETEEKEVKRNQAFAALSIGLICLVVGVPVWWKTTEVYRVQLPYSEIAALADIKVDHVIFIRIVSFSSGINLNELQTLVHFEDESKKKDLKLRLLYIGLVVPSTEEEASVFESATTIQEFDTKLLQKNDINRPRDGNYTVYILPAKDERLQRSIVIGTGQAAFVPDITDIDNLVSWIHNIVRNVFVKEDAVYKALQSTYGGSNMKADKDSMRSLRSSPGYELTFTMLNPQPDVINARWNVKQAIHTYLEPMLSLFEEYANITVKSQYLHYTGLGVRAEKTSNGSRLSSDQLPHIINPVEAYLGSHISTNPNINFIVYIPTRDQSPLHIYDSSGQVSATNAFLSPRWGGLMVYNVDVMPERGVPMSIEVDMKQVLSVFISQLRLILGIHTTIPEERLHVLSPGNQIIANWELDQWLRERCIENVFTSAATLRSLAELIDKISNIVINDDIGAQVVTAVESIHKSVDLLASGHLKEAYLVARKAREASEKAFFDQTLLELLYFPEDQKFAIYIPLFLPVGFPLVLSLTGAIKWLRGSKDKVKKD